jgi:hypothetical protein
VVSGGINSSSVAAPSSVQTHSPNVSVGFTRPSHPQILRTRKIEVAKSKPLRVTAKAKRDAFLSLPRSRTKVRVRRRDLYEMH